MPDQVLIRGGGVAACCCASLLSKAGYPVFVDDQERIGSPVLMLSDQTQRLLHDVFGDQSLLDGAASITKRFVAWGQDSTPVTLPHSGVVVSEATLLNRLWPNIEVQSANCIQPDHWTVCSSKASLTSSSRHTFGSRTAITYVVRLASSDSCWVEALPDGWLFLIPSGPGTGSLISIGQNADVLLQDSRLVAPQISELTPANGSFPASPAIVAPLCQTRSIACGTAAVSFDPIAGEGAGHAIRQGILAAAVIRAAGNGKKEADLLAHYSSRILNGFCRHLEESGRYYSLNADPWWSAELDQMKQGVAWTRSQLSVRPNTAFRLVDFELEQIG